MAGNTWGQQFTVTSFGESHGPAIGCVIDGCPPGVAIDEALLQRDLDRRKPGTSRYVTQRREADEARIVSGVFEGADHRHADRDHHREHRSALARLFQDQGRVPTESRRLRLSAEIRYSRLSRRRAFLGARDRGARGRRRDRAQDPGRTLGHRHPGLSRPDGRYPAWLHRPGRGQRQSVLLRRAGARGRARGLHQSSCAATAIPSARVSTWWPPACRPGGASRCSIDWMPISPRR